MSSGQNVSRWPVVTSIVVALMLSIAPWPEVIANFRPDWVALTLIYWCMVLPRTFSVGTAWLVGLVLDVAQGTLFGQHALALSFIIYIAVKFHLQIRVFPISQMTLTVFALLAIYHFVLFWINGVAGISAPAASHWGPVVAGTIIWPILMIIYGNIRVTLRGGG